MRRIFCVLLAICLLLSLSACRKKNNNTTNSTTDGTLQNQPVTNQPDENDEMVAVSLPTVTQNAIHSDGTTLFQYTYQSMSLVLHRPQVADKIILDFLNRIDSTTEAANTTMEMAKNTYAGSGNWTSYLYHIAYSPTRIDHDVLSLFGNNVVFSGGGHPEKTCVSASYDLLTGDVLTLASIKEKDATMQQFLDLVLDGLAEMAEGNYLYENYKDTVFNRFFDSDPAHDENWYFTQTGLCFYFAPYEIAPYASGVITVEIPYEKLKNIVHEAYLPTPRNTSSGTVEITPFNQVNLTDFSHIAEIVMEQEGNMYMLHTDGTVQDIRIILTDKSTNCTVFAAYKLASGNGIMLQGTENTLKNMKLTYKSGNNTVTVPII